MTREHATTPATAPTHAPIATSLATFVIGERLFGIDVAHVQEMLAAAPLTRVPLAPVHISGLLHLRGAIVTAIDLRGRLGLEARPRSTPPMYVVVTTPEGLVSLAVDDVGDVIDVAGVPCGVPGDVPGGVPGSVPGGVPGSVPGSVPGGAAPSTASSAAPDLVAAVYRLPTGRLLALDVTYLTTVASDTGGGASD